MKGQMCEGKACGMGGGCCCFGHGGWYRVIRVILGIAIIVIAFCFGVMIGELKGALIRETSGHRMMRPSYYGNAYPMMRNGSSGMMGGAPAKTVPSTPAAQSGQ